MTQKNEPKFLVDFMLGRLAKWLRIFGYDSAYVTERSRPMLVMQSLKENRIIITRDHQLPYTRTLKITLIESDRIGEQVRQLIEESLIVVMPARFFTRCTVCNGAIQAVIDKEMVKGLVPEYVYATRDVFSKCTGCGKLYWTGTHRDLLLKDLARLRIKVTE